jgi:hypothetical protein
MPTTIDSAGITFNDTSTITSANTFISKPASPSNGQVLSYNGSTWTGAALSASPSTAKAWVNFDGTTTSANLAGTYSQSGTTVTITTTTAHGLSQGQGISANFTTGTGVDGSYTVASITSPTVFTYIALTSLTTSGNVTLNRSSIRSQYNVSSVTKNGTGEYTVNFATAMADANYTFFGCGRNDTDGTSGYPPCISQWLSDTQSTTQLKIRGTNGNNDLEDFPTICVSIFGN